MKYRDPNTGELKDIYTKTADTLPIGTIVDYDGDTVPDGYVEVDDANNYSTEEQEVGTWIDGKPLYRKTFTLTPAISATTTSSQIEIDLTNVDTCLIKHDKSFWTDSKGNGYFYSFDFVHTNTNIITGIFCRVINGVPQLEVRKGNNIAIGYILATLEYTKTTDVATTSLEGEI